MRYTTHTVMYARKSVSSWSGSLSSSSSSYVRRRWNRGVRKQEIWEDKKREETINVGPILSGMDGGEMGSRQVQLRLLYDR